MVGSECKWQTIKVEIRKHSFLDYAWTNLTEQSLWTGVTPRRRRFRFGHIAKDGVHPKHWKVENKNY